MKFEKWEIITVIISFIILVYLILAELICPIYSIKSPLLYSILTGLFTGIITTIMLLAIQEGQKIKKLKKYYSKIVGSYIRTDMGQDGDPSTV